MSGCESHQWSQTTTVSQDPEQPKIIPPIAAVPTRKPAIANPPDQVFGDYDSALMKAVQNRWGELLKKSEYRIGEKAGQVVVKFNLHADGTISDLSVAESTLGPDLTKLCQATITEAAPFRPWPAEMKAKVDGDFRELTFKFRYP
jgi:outer membrane biosynthesis protein TonB